VTLNFIWVKMRLRFILGFSNGKENLPRRGASFMKKSNIYIITGGTMVHVTPHFSICAPAYGKVGLELYRHLNANSMSEKYNIYLIKTKMAGFNADDVVAHLKDLNIKSTIETNDDLEGLVTTLSQERDTKAIIMSSAICDFEPKELLGYEDKTPLKITQFGKDKKRLHKAHSLELKLQPSTPPPLKKKKIIC